MFNIKKFIFGVLAVLLVAGTIWFFRTEIKSFINRLPKNPVIVFPAIKNQTIAKKDFDNKSLPLEISRFILDGAEKKTLWKLEYADVDLVRIIGFELAYELNLNNYNLIRFYEDELDVVKDNGWELLAASLGDSQAFLDAGRKNPSADYQIRISAEQKDNRLEVKVQYLITRD